MIKLVTIDLDGTLFDKVKNVSAENRRALREAKEAGCKIVIATGRPFSGVLPLLEDLGLTSNDDYVIIYNGAKVFNVGTGEVIFTSNIDGKVVKELYHEALRLNMNYHAFRANEELITNEHNPYTDVEATINHVEDHLFDIDKVNDDDSFIKAMIVGSDEDLTRIIPLVDKKFSTEYSMLRSSKIFLEFLKKDTHKGNGLVALAKHLNIDIKDTMAIGDAGNDLPMILEAGIGVAMDNAFADIKAQADFITKSNEESGVAYAIDKFVLNK